MGDIEVLFIPKGSSVLRRPAPHTYMRDRLDGYLVSIYLFQCPLPLPLPSLHMYTRP